MKKLTQFLCILLVCMLLLPTAALAANAGDTRASNYFVATSAKLKKTSTGVEVWFDLTGTGMMDQIGARMVVIQRSTDGSSWTTVKTFTKESYPQMIRENFAAHTCSLTYTAAAGYYYRAYVVFYAKKGTGTGELVQYTSSLKL